MTGATAMVTSPVTPRPDAEVAPVDVDRRRFTIAVVVGIAAVSIPYLWILWDLWSGSANPLRTSGPGNFYELQARAMISGHLSVPTGSLGIEAFVHAHRQYTYFGLFPSLIRVPIVLVTDQFDGRLTAPSLLAAWVVTGVFSSLALWRIRLLLRGRTALGRIEATSYGVLVAAITGGSVLVYLAATPFVYNEDIAWSVALTLASMFALLGVLERPSWGRMALAGCFILAANLDRSPTGYACVIGALLVAAWFLLGRGGPEGRRWALPAAVVGLVPLGVSCAVNWAKFGLPFGLPMADQVWTHVNAHRAYFLAANGGKAFSLRFVPSTANAYLNPAGLRVSSVFPFITLPAAPAPALAGVVLDETFPTASLTASMPLLFLLTCWGAVAAFRPRPVGRARLMCIPLLASAAAVTGALVWGLIIERYTADFLPLLILGGALGLVDIWVRLAHRRRRIRLIALGLIALVALFSVVANMGAAVAPTSQWTSTQLEGFVTAQHSITPGALQATVTQGPALPYWAPAGRLFIIDNCRALYVSNGRSFKDVPGQQLQHFTWLAVEQGAGINHAIAFSFNQPDTELHQGVPLLTYGSATLVIEPAGSGLVRFRVEHPGAPGVAWPSATGSAWRPKLHKLYRIDVATDPYLQSIVVSWANGSGIIGHYLEGTGPAVVQATTAASVGPPLVSVADVTGPPPAMGLCRSLLPGA